jgi:glycine/D-amino acid oxidase-like deaminating enzyme
MSQEYDVIVAGAGMAGAAIGYGLAGMNRRVLMLDGADTDFRAAKANFGLVWVKAKGLGIPATSDYRFRLPKLGLNLQNSCRQKAV